MTDTKQRVREFYDEIGWQQEGDGQYQNARYDDLRPVVKEYIHDTRMRVNRWIAPTGKYLLDAGSGPVQYDEYLTYSSGYQWRVCLDISIQALREARKNIGGHGLFVVGDLANLPFEASVFDGEVSMHAIHHLPLEEHVHAYDELYRVLKFGRTAAVVNGWYQPLIIRMAEPLIGLMRLLTGKGAKKKKNWLAEEAPEGTFVNKMTPAWLKREVGSRMPLEIQPWRSMSTRLLRWFVHPQLGGRLFLLLVFQLEDAFPKFFGENGQFPLIVIRKPEN